MYYSLYLILNLTRNLPIFLDYILPTFIWSLSISIAISTMTTKQHYFLDFVTGIIFATIGILILKKCIEVTEKNHEKIINQLES